MKYANLLSPTHIGPLELTNRVVMSPLTTNYAAENTGFVTDQMVEYYRQRALGEVGLVIVEGAIVREDGRGFSKQLMVHHDDTICGLSKLSAAIIESGSKAVLQIMHHGRQTREKIAGSQPVAPSPIPCPVFKEVPKELSVQEIKELQIRFVEAALRAQKSGFDGVEFHAAHGYLISGFLSPWSNRRQDEYGGSLENRLRFLTEIIEQTKFLAGEKFAILCRISANEYVEGGLDTEEVIAIAKQLQQKGVDALDVSAAVAATFIHMSPPTGSPQAPYADMAKRIKEELNIPVISVARILTPDTADDIIGSGNTDLVALGRALVADPHWVSKSKAGRELEIIPCIGCNVCNGRSNKPEVYCIVNPFTGREQLKQLNTAHSHQRVAILGNGIVGYHAALELQEQGHQVKIFEDPDLPFGGLTGLRAKVPLQHEIKKVTDYFWSRLQSSGITQSFLPALIDEEFDLVISTLVRQSVSTGITQPWQQSWKDRVEQLGLQQHHAIDVLINGLPVDQDVVIVGGSLLGCETANFLSTIGLRQVVIVEEKKRVPYDVGNTMMQVISRELRRQGVRIYQPDVDDLLTERTVVVWATDYPSKTTEIPYGSNQRASLYHVGDSYQPDIVADLMAQISELIFAKTNEVNKC